MSGVMSIDIALNMIVAGAQIALRRVPTGDRGFVLDVATNYGSARIDLDAVHLAALGAAPSQAARFPVIEGV